MLAGWCIGVGHDLCHGMAAGTQRADEQGNPVAAEACVFSFVCHVDLWFGSEVDTKVETAGQTGGLEVIGFGNWSAGKNVPGQSA